MNFNFRFSPKIMHKGLALFVVPVILNAVWVVLLSQALAHSQALIEQERQHSDNIEHINAAMEKMFNASGNVFSYMFSADEQYLNQVRKYVLDLRKEIAIIATSLNMTDKERSALTGIADSYDGFVAQLEPVGSSAELDPILKFRSIRVQMRTMMSKAAVLASHLRHTIDAQKSALVEARAQEVRTKNAVNNIVIGGMVLNLLIASILSFLFLRDISRKLNILVKNAERLPKRLALQEPLSGADELTYLDGAMHAASDDLKKAFDHRASLMQMVAHDLRSPLTSAQLSLDLIQAAEADSLSAKSIQHLERIGNSNRMVLGLINDLLTVDALELGQMEIAAERVAVKSMVGESIASVTALASAKKIELLDFSGGEYVSADSRRIVQVLVNLLSNAIKFSANNSTIKVVSTREGGQVEIAVVDKGVGMSAEDCRHIFEKFYQASDGRHAEGYGLGLAICKLIVTSHGGQIGVSSNPGMGSRFWFRLKAARDAAV